jgi:hypothetical protein
MSVTYYLGAGASAKKIPCVADLSKEIREMAVFIKGNSTQEEISYSFNGKHKINLGSDKRERSIQIIEEFCNELDGQLSIDTLAKIYWIQNDRFKLTRLKSILFASLIFWERKGIDQRYLNFWATITSVHSTLIKDSPGYIEFPGTINVLSWNYDSQLERAFREIFPNADDIWDAHGKTNGKNIFKYTGVNFKKLNGSVSMPASFSIGSPGAKDNGLYDMTEYQMAYFIADIIGDQQGIFYDQIEGLKFCWEHSPPSIIQDNSFKDNYYKIDTTEVLVVIGYTFPSINHSLDFGLIKTMKNLKKVYFQGANRADAERIKDYFQAVLPESHSNIKLIPIDSNGFFIPPEATIEIEKNDISMRSGSTSL